MSEQDCPHGRLYNNCPICNELPLGATGEHPLGKLRPGDEGGLLAAISTQDGRIVVNFGPKEIAWIALEPHEAIQFGQALIDFAKRLTT